MMKLFVILLSSLLLSAQVQAKEDKDPFDTSATEKKIKELGVPTIASVDQLGKKAKELFLANNCT